MHTTPRQRALAIIGFLHMGMGFRLVVRPGDGYDPDLAVWHEAIPLWVRVTLWATIGVVCVVACLLSPWSDRAEKIGWGAATIMPMERALSFGWSWLMWVVPGWPPGALESLGGSLVWGGIFLLVKTIAGMPEPQEHPPMHESMSVGQ